MNKILTFGGDEQGGHLEHGLSEGLGVFLVQRAAHLIDHQLAEVRLTLGRLREMDHPSHLHGRTD